ncbi:protein of unknown function [Candidatus Hydrogenisulfobacillus filiaventi]|uniref:Uncharacterized protein n=1 Tax=Candidatus Hydrogenisulfobacillus filiaventi TaxID=2707344 RepID=A0A6F8ZIP7_9FIRM|nr:protein of unknown function [Candidatus Hydrogenisulfobacillus filiaventi]
MAWAWMRLIRLWADRRGVNNLVGEGLLVVIVLVLALVIYEAVQPNGAIGQWEQSFINQIAGTTG